MTATIDPWNMSSYNKLKLDIEEVGVLFKLHENVDEITMYKL